MKRGFTIVELMFTIAIIMTLAAVVVPGFISAKCQADFKAYGEVPEKCQGLIHLHDEDR